MQTFWDRMRWFFHSAIDAAQPFNAFPNQAVLSCLYGSDSGMYIKNIMGEMI